ncbi:MAG: Uma2 family endonuclease [Butyrivibrio sp.]|nr:Uma2 family endonuclease [Butyrivibrio sp.]
MEDLKENINGSADEQGIYTVEDWLKTSEDRRVELINGNFYDLAAPSRVHQWIVSKLLTKINNHIDSKGGDCEAYPAPFGVQLNKDKKTIVEPDITVVCDKNKLTDRGCVGAPDWIIEVVSPSTASMDYVKKRELYMNVGVKEYWIVNPETGDITTYTEERPFIPQCLKTDEKCRSYIYPDLEIDFQEIINQI